MKLAKAFVALKNELLHIKANKLDPDWQTARKISKEENIEFKAAIHEVYEYNRAHGSTQIEKIVQINYTQPIKALMHYKERDELNSEELRFVTVLETVIAGTARRGIADEVEYHQILHEAKEEVNRFYVRLATDSIRALAAERQLKRLLGKSKTIQLSLL